MVARASEGWPSAVNAGQVALPSTAHTMVASRCMGSRATSLVYTLITNQRTITHPMSQPVGTWNIKKKMSQGGYQPVGISC